MAQWYRIHLQMQGTQETQVQSLGREDPLEEEMVTYINGNIYTGSWKW